MKNITHDFYLLEKYNNTMQYAILVKHFREYKMHLHKLISRNIIIKPLMLPR